MLAYIYPVDDQGNPIDPGFGRPGGGGPVDPGYGRPGGGHPSHGLPPIFGGGRPSHPIYIPPLPSVWPPAGTPTQPIALPPEESIGVPSQPIYISGTPEHPITIPPGQVWPPLPGPDPGPDPRAILIWVVGVGARWYVLAKPDQGLPPGPQPK